MLRCIVCLALSPEERRHCAECGEPLLAACPSCLRPRMAGSLRCGGCGEFLPVPFPEAEVAVTPTAVRNLRAFLHPRDRRGSLELLESAELLALLRELPPGPGPAPAIELRPLEGEAARVWAARIGGAARLALDEGEGVRLVGGGLRIGRRIEPSLDASERDFLLLGALFPRLCGLAHHVDLDRRARGAEGLGVRAREGQEALRAWRRYHRLSGDRFAFALGGGDLRVAAGALVKDLAARREAPPGVLDRLEVFRRTTERARAPAAGFAPFRALFEGAPAALERAFELFAFSRSPAAQALGNADLPSWLGLPAAPSSAPAEEAGTPGVAPRAARGARRSPAPAPTQAPPAPEESPSIPFLGEGAGEALYYLSAFRGDLRVLGAEAPRRLDLSGHVALPTRLAVGPRGEVWIADGEAGTLLRLDPDGGVAARLETGVRRPGALALDPQGRLYLVDRRAGRLRVYAPDGRELREVGGQLAAPLRAPEGMGLLPEGAGAWVSDPPTGRLLRLDPEGAEVWCSPAGTLEDPQDLSACADGGVWVVDGVARRLVRFGPRGVRDATLPVPGASVGLEGARVRSRGDGGVVLLDRGAARLHAWDAHLRPEEEVRGLCVPEDRYGYFCDLALGPAPARRAAAPPVVDGARARASGE